MPIIYQSETRTITASTCPVVDGVRQFPQSVSEFISFLTTDQQQQLKSDEFTWEESLTLTHPGGLRFEGCVISLREYNGYQDSDFYAVVWDERLQKVRSIMYATTSAYCTTYAKVDVTPENLAKAREWSYHQNLAKLSQQSLEVAKTPKAGKFVKVIKGRKVPVGTQGVVIHVTPPKKFSFRSPAIIQVGIATSDICKESVDRNGSPTGKVYHQDVVWTNINNVEVVEWEQYLLSEDQVAEKARYMADTILPTDC